LGFDKVVTPTWSPSLLVVDVLVLPLLPAEVADPDMEPGPLERALLVPEAMELMDPDMEGPPERELPDPEAKELMDPEMELEPVMDPDMELSPILEPEPIEPMDPDMELSPILEPKPMELSPVLEPEGMELMDPDMELSPVESELLEPEGRDPDMEL